MSCSPVGIQGRGCQMSAKMNMIPHFPCAAFSRTFSGPTVCISCGCCNERPPAEQLQTAPLPASSGGRAGGRALWRPRREPFLAPSRSRGPRAPRRPWRHQSAACLRSHVACLRVLTGAPAPASGAHPRFTNHVRKDPISGSDHVPASLVTGALPGRDSAPGTDYVTQTWARTPGQGYGRISGTISLFYDFQTKSIKRAFMKYL